MNGFTRPAIFVDTGAWIALLQETDTHHVAASTVGARLKQQRTRLITTNFVIAETHAMLLRAGYAPAVTFLRKVTAGQVAIVIRAEADDEAAARAIIYQYTDKKYSLVDAISFAVMTRLGITQAWSYDQHFRQHGWQVLES
jgi:predicted nucleic acid-binding protein